ncbi:unnamed protein product, partial [Brassica rapa]
TSVAVHQYTYQHVGPWTQHTDPPCGLFGTLVLGLSMLALPVDCLGNFGPRGLSVQYTQDVRRCPPAHTGRPLLYVANVCVCPSAQTGRLWQSISTHRTFLAVHQYTYQHVGPWTQHDDPPCGLFGTHRTSGGVRQHTHDVCTCLWLSVSTHRTSVAVRVCLSAHTGRPCVSVSTHRPSVCVRQHTQDVSHTHDVCGCPCVSVGVHQHTQDVRGCPWLSVSTHRTSVCLRQHKQDVCVCPSAHTGRPCVSVSTHRKTSVGVRQHTHDVRGGLMLALPVDCLGDFVPSGLSVQYTQDVHGCPPAHTGRPGPFVADVRGCPCVSVSTHRTSVAVHKYTYQHVGPWTLHAGHSRGLFGTHRTSVGVRQHTQDVRGGPCVSVSTHRTSVADVRRCSCVSVCVRQHTHDFRGCPSVHISAQWSLDSARWPFPWTVWVILSHVGCLFSTHRTSVGVRQHTQDVRGCPCVFVCVHQHTQDDVRGCPSVHISARWSLDSACWPFPWTVWHTQNVHGCPSAHTGRLWVFVSTHMTSVAVRVCP